jgi:hypothetical protein
MSSVLCISFPGPQIPLIKKGSFSSEMHWQRAQRRRGGRAFGPRLQFGHARYNSYIIHISS